VHLCLTNQTERTVGPFEVFIDSGGISSDDRCVMLNGLQKMVSNWSDGFVVMSIYADCLLLASEL
jgi:trafficking protein particle complex subunit 13